MGRYTASVKNDTVQLDQLTTKISWKVCDFGHKIRKNNQLLIQRPIDGSTVYVQCPFQQSDAKQVKEQTISCIQSVLEQTLNLGQPFWNDFFRKTKKYTTSFTNKEL